MCFCRKKQILSTVSWQPKGKLVSSLLRHCLTCSYLAEHSSTDYFVLFTERGWSSYPQHEDQSKHEGKYWLNRFWRGNLCCSLIAGCLSIHLSLLGQRSHQVRFEEPADAQGGLVFTSAHGFISTKCGVILILFPCGCNAGAQWRKQSSERRIGITPAREIWQFAKPPANHSTLWDGEVLLLISMQLMQIPFISDVLRC